MKIAAAQIHPRFAQMEKNRILVGRYCEKAANQEVDLLIFPELCISGYNFSSKNQVRSLAESVPQGPSVKRLSELAKEHYMTIVAGIAELGSNDQMYNSAVIVTHKGFLGKYRKIHLFAREKEWFQPGNKPPRVWHVPKATIGVLVCFDWAFPEVARILMLQGCEILCLPANLILPYAQQTMITRSIENRIFTILANRIGSEKKLTFTGQSQITDPEGTVLVQGGTQRTGLFTAEINPTQAHNKFLTKTNHIIKDRRIDLYQQLLQP